MKNKKKWLKTLSSTILATSLVPLAATACTVSSIKYSNQQQSNLDINTLSWMKRTEFTTNDIAQIQNIVKQDNQNLFDEYEGLESSITITPTVSGTNINVAISATGSYSGSFNWNAKYVFVKQDVNLIKWVIRTEYGSNVSSTIISTIQSDNSAIFSDWSYVTINVNMVNSTLIHIAITTTDSTKYSGSVSWNATFVTTKRNISSYSFKMREVYTSTNVDTIKNTIKSDNSGIFTDWNNVTLNVYVINTYFINVIISTYGSTVYSGSINWAARYASTDKYVYIQYYNSGLSVKTDYKTGSYGWYREWSDGWLEHGGYVQVPSGAVTVQLLFAFNDTNYTVIPHVDSSNGEIIRVYGTKTTTTFQLDSHGTGSDMWCDWVAFGKTS